MKVKLSKFLRWSTEPKEPKAAPVPVQEQSKQQATPASSSWATRANARVFWLSESQPAVGKVAVDDSIINGECVVNAPTKLGVDGQAWLVLNDGKSYPVVVKDRTTEGDTDHLTSDIAKALGPEPKPKPEHSARWSWIGDGGVLVTEWASLRNVADGKVELMSSRTPPFPSLVMISGTTYNSVASTVETRIQDKMPVTIVEVLDTFEAAN